MIEAFGESLTLRTWLTHPKCGTTREEVIRARLRRGWTPEEAISRPSQNQRLLVTAFGDTRPAKAWIRDDRCVVPYSTLLFRLHAGEMTPEQAMTTPPRGGSGTTMPRLVTAWGETRTCGQWSKDRRCTVRRQVIYQRVRKGWTAEDAISLPLRTRNASTRYTVFGETKTLREWAQDRRCHVSLSTIRRRLAEGLNFKHALTAPGRAGTSRATVRTVT